MDIRNILNKTGQAIDYYGNKYHNIFPELGISERLQAYGNNNTQETGDVQGAIPPDRNPYGPVYNGPFPQPTNLSNVPASGSSGSGTNNSNIQEVNGQYFDLSNPNDLQRFYDASNARYFEKSQQVYQDFIKGIDRSQSNLDYNTGLSLKDLLAQRYKLRADKENYFATLEKNGQDFVTGKMLGDSNRQNYFSGLGANAFQSSQATSQDYADNQFARGLAEQQKYGADATNNFALQSSGYDTQQANINRQAGQDYQDLADSRSTALMNRDNYFAENKNQLATGLANYSSDLGNKDYASKYKLQAYASPNAYQPDYSQAKAYTNFQPAQQATTPNTPGYAFSNLNPSQMTPQDEYFGYKSSENDKKRINNYFAGRAF